MAPHEGGCHHPGLATGHAVPEQLVARHPSSPGPPRAGSQWRPFQHVPSSWAAWQRSAGAGQAPVRIPRRAPAGSGNLRKSSSHFQQGGCRQVDAGTCLTLRSLRASSAQEAEDTHLWVERLTALGPQIQP